MISRAQDDLFSRACRPARSTRRSSSDGPGSRALVRHELVTMLAQSTRRRVGLLLRKVLTRCCSAACGRNVVFGQHVVLRHPHKIRIGDNVVIDDNCLIDAKGDTQQRHRDRQRRVHRPQHDPVVQERRHRRSTTA